MWYRKLWWGAWLCPLLLALPLLLLPLLTGSRRLQPSRLDVREVFPSCRLPLTNGTTGHGATASTVARADVVKCAVPVAVVGAAAVTTTDATTTVAASAPTTVVLGACISCAD